MDIQEGVGGYSACHCNKVAKQATSQSAAGKTGETL